MADRWHPKDRRKIQRSLEIWLKTGKRASDVYAGQQEQGSTSTEDSRSQSTLRFDPLVFWVNTKKEDLWPRLDARVVSMLAAGLLDEVHSMSQLKAELEAEGKPVDSTRGIWIAIGYKEFADYTAATLSNHSPTELQALKQQAIEKTQTVTRRYAKSQLRWIQYKFLNALIRAGGSGRLFLLDGSHLPRWDDQVTQSARLISGKFLGGSALPDPIDVAGALKKELMPKGEDLSQNRELWKKRTCDICGVVAVTEKLWETHIQSNKHQKALRSRRPTGDSSLYKDNAPNGPPKPLPNTQNLASNGISPG
jgi:tRNA dimethylallyltransferase